MVPEAGEVPEDRLKPADQQEEEEEEEAEWEEDEEDEYYGDEEEEEETDDDDLGYGGMFTYARLNVLERQERWQEYLNLARAEGMSEKYLNGLFQLKRYQEAVEYAISHMSHRYNRMRLIEELLNYGEQELARDLIEKDMEKLLNLHAKSLFQCILQHKMFGTVKLLVEQGLEHLSGCSDALSIAQKLHQYEEPQLALHVAEYAFLYQSMGKGRLQNGFIQLLKALVILTEYLWLLWHCSTYILLWSCISALKNWPERIGRNVVMSASV